MIPGPLPDPSDNLHFGDVRLRFVRIVPGDDARGLVPYYHFRILEAAGQEVGHINFRVGDTEHVRLYAGHIGYEIAEAFRGHRFAYQACCALAPFVRSFYSSVVITCDPENHASFRVIQRLGAAFLERVSVPPSDVHYKTGSRSKNRYEWTP